MFVRTSEGYLVNLLQSFAILIVPDEGSFALSAATTNGETVKLAGGTEDYCASVRDSLFFAMIEAKIGMPVYELSNKEPVP